MVIIHLIVCIFYILLDSMFQLHPLPDDGEGDVEGCHEQVAQGQVGDEQVRHRVQSPRPAKSLLKKCYLTSWSLHC